MAASPAIRNARPTIFRNKIGTWCHQHTKLLVASAKTDLEGEECQRKLKPEGGSQT